MVTKPWLIRLRAWRTTSTVFATANVSQSDKEGTTPRQTMTRESDDAFTILNEQRMADGRFVAVDCRASTRLSH
ncbi:MAG TPA: hypothetical protein VG943_14020 [Caulobacterales bacterium]|nr:hypothetical protein [Caulobacterales bacterium]